MKGEFGAPRELEVLVERSGLSPALTLGFGAGLYFEYFRRPQPSPTHYIRGLRRDLFTTDAPLSAPVALTRERVAAALAENARWFNLDRAPTTALLGMEMLAEELPHYDAIADWVACLQGMASTIKASRSLYRRDYATFLNESTPCLPAAAGLAQELAGVAGEWDKFAELSGRIAAERDATQLERLSRLVRRIAALEEHFWGNALSTVSAL